MGKTFVQVSIDILGILPILRGTSAQVILCVAAFEADPIGPSVTDLCDYTQASRPSIYTALRILCKSDILREQADEAGVSRYRINPQYVRFSAPEPIMIRESVHLNASHKGYKKLFDTPPVVVCSPESSNPVKFPEEKQQTTPPAHKIFDTLGVEGSALVRLGQIVPAAVAQAWAEWIPNAPESWHNPVAFMVKHLMANPHEQPPAARKREPGPWWASEFDKYINR